MTSLALATSSGVPWTTSMYWSVFRATSYFNTLSFGTPMLTSPAPTALTPPTTAAPSRPAMIQPTSGPATRTGPIPGMANAAEPNRSPQNPPQNAPTLPQYFMRSPAL